MSKKRTAIVALAIAAVTAVSGGTYAVSGLTGETRAAPPAVQSTVSEAVATTVATAGTSSATDSNQSQELRTQILDMLGDHMGITGPEADELASTMAELMQKNGNTNAADMVKKCTETAGQMMGNSEMMGGGGQMMGAGGMMNDASPSPSATTDSASAHESHHSSGS